MDNLSFFCFICTMLVTLQTSHGIQEGCPKFDEDRSCRKNEVRFYFRAKIGDNAISEELYVEDVATITNANFLKETKLKFIVHGHAENKDDFLVKPLQEEYFKLGYNVVMIDYGWLSQQTKKKSCYRTGVENSNDVAICAARMIEAIIEHNVKGIKIDHFHLLGLSLGGQIVGQIPHRINHMFRGRIPRITGIDPANDGFFDDYGTDEFTLRSTDAILVDVIHSNAGINGVLPPRGHIDWYPNGGTFQPECPQGSYLCNHISSLIYYLESIGDPNFKIKAQWCPNLETKNFNPKSCEDLAEVSFGENVTSEDIKSKRMKEGVYFFETKDTFPYMRKGATEYPVYAIHREIKE